MITLTLLSVPQRPIEVDEETITNYGDNYVEFSSGQSIPVAESEETITEMLQDIVNRLLYQPSPTLA